MSRPILIHGHFYQPPRENPWTEIVERQPSAAPAHDWNERVYRECYRPNAYARVYDADGRIARILDNYSALSFNFGPTLLSWMEQNHPRTYRRILEIDAASISAHNGHGNAIAQGFGHAILPLCNDRDRRTQIRWGLADFRYRFGREAESLWLPETAVDEATLADLIDERVRYVILAPHQIRLARGGDLKPGDAKERAGRGGATGPSSARPQAQSATPPHRDAPLDPGRPYRFSHPDGSDRSIAVFIYDGGLAQSIAFGGALASSHSLLDQVRRAGERTDGLIHAATDGESYGHHSKFAELTLVHAHSHAAHEWGFRFVNYGEYLDEHPAEIEVELNLGEDGLGSSWSCRHGVGRWMRDCGCQTGGEAHWQQGWRAPLREALNLLRDAAAERFETDLGELTDDPWRLRDAYVRPILDPQVDPREFLGQEVGRALTGPETEQSLLLLELQRNSLLSFTSCGWFFNDLAGIETVQILRYAARALDLLEEAGGPSLRDPFLEILAQAESNRNEAGNGADLFRREVDTERVTPHRVAAHAALSSLVEPPVGADDDFVPNTGVFRARLDHVARESYGTMTLATGSAEIENRRTAQQTRAAFAATYLGGTDFHCALRPFEGSEALREAHERLDREFRSGSLTAILAAAKQEFGPEESGLEHLLPSGRDHISSLVFGDLVEQFSAQYASLYESHQRTLDRLETLGFSLPQELRIAAEATLARRLRTELTRFAESRDPVSYQRARVLSEEMSVHGQVLTDAWAEDLLTELLCSVDAQDETTIWLATACLELAERLGIDLRIERAQERLLESAWHLSEPGPARELAWQLAISPSVWKASTEPPDSPTLSS